MPLWLLGILKSKVARLAALFLAVYLLAYFNGRGDANEKHARLSAQAAQEWADKIAAAKDRSYKDGLAVAQQTAANAVTVEELIHALQSEPGAATGCLSGDTVRRLRNLH